LLDIQFSIELKCLHSIYNIMYGCVWFSAYLLAWLETKPG
jgi:hypothetical protein